jgi:hypothetical protein
MFHKEICQSTAVSTVAKHAIQMWSIRGVFMPYLNERFGVS